MGTADTRYFVYIEQPTTIEWKGTRPFRITVNRNTGTQDAPQRDSSVFDQEGAKRYDVPLTPHPLAYEVLIGDGGSGTLSPKLGMKVDAETVVDAARTITFAPDRTTFSIKHPWPTPGLTGDLGNPAQQATARYFLALPESDPIVLKWSATADFGMTVCRNDGTTQAPLRKVERVLNRTRHGSMQLDGSVQPYEILIGHPDRNGLFPTAAMKLHGNEVADVQFGVSFGALVRVQDPEDPWPTATQVAPAVAAPAGPTAAPDGRSARR
jgi:hypothetical protein